jgi:hypothetical protein
MQNNNKRSDGDVNDITLRDYFAAKALQSLIRGFKNLDTNNTPILDALSDDAYKLANSMMKARGKWNAKNS